ncbi:TIGR01212 family radical SAM protein [Clostridium sp. AM58-1XD]|nr:TIGR01212 family radical SAM protein [Clostridium sp. AM58-1XD]
MADGKILGEFYASEADRVRDWNGKPYYSLDYYLKETFGQKVYKLALDGGQTCPNRDGACGRGGCIFCSEGGSGDFAVPLFSDPSFVRMSPLSPCPQELLDHIPPAVYAQIEEAKKNVSRKIAGRDRKYIAYFQSFTNTYAPVPYLKQLFSSAASHPDIAALSIGTRPDCLPDEIIRLLSDVNVQKPVWTELGLQTIHEDTARFIRRGYPLNCFLNTFHRLKAAGLPVIVHVILGLPGETREMMLRTVRFLGELGIDGIKLQLLHVLTGTELAALYGKAPFPTMELPEYLDLVIDCIGNLPPSVVIHRISGDGPKKLLVAPLWSANKRLVLNSMTRRFKERGISQGDLLS